MFPRRHAVFKQAGRYYVVLDPTDGETLADAIEQGLDLPQLVSLTVQLTQALRRLHAAGWALIGLTPADVVLGQPLRISQLGTATRIGKPTAQALHVAGYSAPELVDADGPAITGKEDVYTLGALLYRVLAGEPVPEAGAELSQLPSLVPIPGARSYCRRPGASRRTAGPRRVLRAVAST